MHMRVRVFDIETPNRRIDCEPSRLKDTNAVRMIVSTWNSDRNKESREMAIVMNKNELRKALDTIEYFEQKL